MAVYTLADYYKSLDPENKIAVPIRILSQTNAILQDIPFKEGNLDTGEQVNIDTKLPEVAYKSLNAGIVPSVGNQAQFIEQCGQAGSWMKLDRDLANRGGNAPAYRMSKWPKYMESMGQAFANRLFYGNVASEPQAFTGIMPRYSSLSAGNGGQIIDAGGSGSDNASAVLVEWGDEKVVGLYPRGSKAGLRHFDHGLQIDQNTGGQTGALNCFYFDEWMWQHGLCVYDYRCIVRVANIDISDLQDEAAAQADLIEMMEHAESLLPSEEGSEMAGKRVWYMNRTIKRFLRKQFREGVGAGGGLTYENVDGKRVLMFGGTPVRIVDQLVNTESRVA